MLSDACSEFFDALAQNAKELAEQAHWYSSPDTLIAYGQEIDALRRASVRVAENPYDLEASSELLRLAASIQRFYDTPPDTPEVESRGQEMLALAKLLSEGKSDNQDVAALARDLARDDERGKEAADQVRGILKRISGPAYEAAKKIITDVASATVKHMLGL